MSFQIGPPDRPSPRTVRRPPPNYASSSMRWRLFAIIATVLLLVGVVGRLDNPRIRQLLGLAERPIAGGVPLTDQEIADDEVDTRLAPPSPSEASNDIRVMPYKSSEIGASTSGGREARQNKPSRSDEIRSTPVIEAEAGDDPSEEIDRAPATVESSEQRTLKAAWRDAWIALLRECPAADENRLYDRLRAARGRGPAASDEPVELTAWSARVAVWDTAWQTYVQEARAGLKTLSAKDRTRWNKVLDEVAASWLALWRPLLETLGQEQPESREVAALVELLQNVADEKSMKAIQDDTIWRGSETNVWFRLVEHLRSTDADKFRQESVGPTGYLQLFKQPGHYRGKIVTVRGTVRLGYRVDAPPNAEGVKEYTLLWLHPAGGPSSPLVIYALETPEGFPAIKHRDRDRGTTTLHEEIECTGYFFKRWAYEGHDGIHVAPLILALSPRWIAPTDDTTDDAGSGTLIVVILVSAAIGIGVAVVAVRNTRRR